MKRLFLVAFVIILAAVVWLFARGRSTSRDGNSEQPAPQEPTVRVQTSPSAHPVTPSSQVPQQVNAVPVLPVEETWVETSAEVKPNGTTRLNFADAAIIVHQANRYWMELTSTNHEDKYGMTATFFTVKPDNRRGERLSESVVWESHSVVNGKSVYHADRSQVKIVLPDGLVIPWSYGGDKAGWLYPRAATITIRVWQRTSGLPARGFPLMAVPSEVERTAGPPLPGASDF